MKRYPSCLICLIWLFSLLNQCWNHSTSQSDWLLLQERDAEASTVALKSYRRALKAAEAGEAEDALKNLLLVVNRGPEITEAWTKACNQYIVLGQSDRCIELLREGLLTERIGRPGELHVQLCELLLWKTKRHYDSEAGRSAIEHCTRALEYQPQDARVYFQLGELHAWAKDSNLAVRYFDEGFRLNPAETRALPSFARALLYAGEVQRAKSLTEKLLRQMPGHVGLYNLMVSIMKVTEPFSSEAVRYQQLAVKGFFSSFPSGEGKRACKFTVHFDPVAASDGKQVSSRLLFRGGEKYGHGLLPRTFTGSSPPPRIVSSYTGKAMWLVTFVNHYMAGKSGTVFNDCSVFLADNGLNTPFQELSAGQLGRGQTPTKPIKFQAKQPVASAVQVHTSNHYHGLVEVMSRVILLVESVLVEDPRCALLVPSGWFYSDLFALIGSAVLPEKRVLRWDGAAGSRHHFSKLHTIFFRQEDPDDPNPKNDWFYIHIPPLRPLQRLRELLQRGLPDIVPLAAGETPSGAILYVSRVDAKLRRVYGEERLLHVLRHYIGSPVRSFVGSEMPIRQQLLSFQRAAVVIGPQGAGLANMIAMSSGHLILFPFAPYSDGMMSHLAMALGIELWMVPDLSGFYYGHFNATSRRCKQVLLTTREVLRTIAPIHPWAGRALTRSQWEDLDSDNYDKVPNGKMWNQDPENRDMSIL